MESLNLIKKRVQGSSYTLLGALSFDEMRIMHKLQSVSGTVHGRVDYGDGVEALQAKEALVFCVVCVNKKWKIPIAYYLVNGVDAEKKANLIQQCLIAMHEINFKVISVTCGGTPTNLASLQMLGCNLDIKDLKTDFHHPVSDEKVCFLLDASHMLKLIRNTFDSSKIMDSEGGEIDFRYVEK